MIFVGKRRPLWLKEKHVIFKCKATRNIMIILFFDTFFVYSDISNIYKIFMNLFFQIFKIY